MKRKIIASSLVVAAGVATAGGLAFAKASHGENDAVADLAKANVSLIQAITNAEAHAGGKATKAELESRRGTAVAYEVEVVTADRQVVDLKVDATDGKVLSSKQDRADHDGEHDDD